MNRIGDIGLLTAIIILYTVYHTFDIDQLFGANALVRSTSFSIARWLAIYSLRRNIFSRCG